MQFFLYTILSVKILLVSLENLHTLACLNLNYDNRIVTKNVKGVNMVGFIKTFDQYPHQFNFGHFFSSSFKLYEDLSLNFRSKFYDFSNHGCLPCAILKALYYFKVTKAHEGRDSQSLSQNIQNEIFEILKGSKHHGIH